MIDLNDKRVFYSKLMSLIHQKPNSDDLQASLLPDMPLSAMPNNKIYEKMINKTKKIYRIKIAKGKGGNDNDEKSKDELVDEKDIELINLLNHPNPAAPQVASMFGSKHMSLNKLGGAKKQRKIINYHHSDVANTFQFNIWRMTKDKVKNLHRFDMSRLVEAELLSGKAAKWHIKLLNNSDANYPLKK